MGFPMRDLCQRTKTLALRIVKMYAKLPKETVAQVLGKQVLRSGTSVAANVREASRARSDAEFVSKLGIVEAELDETLLWLELLTESGTVKADRMADLRKETDELLRIVVASIKTKKRNR
jgi:four helix bundle protein